MTSIDVSYQIVKKVLSEGISYKVASKNAFKQPVKGVDRSISNGLAGCFLRHYLAFEYNFKQLGIENQNDFILVSFALANKLFVKKCDENEMMDEIADKLEVISKEQLEEYLNKFDAIEKFIPDELGKESDEFLSLRYNTPLWVVKMWRKQFSLRVAYNLLKANNKIADLYFRYSKNSGLNFDELLQKYDLFEQYKDTEYFCFKDKKPVQGYEPVSKRYAIPSIPGMSLITDKIDADPLRGVAIYQANNLPIIEELYAIYGPNFKADVITDAQDVYFSLKNSLSRLVFNSVNLYECPVTSLITVISNKVHTVICAPKSSSLASLRGNPSYFLNVKQEELDGILENEKLAMEECATFVEDDGNLVYLIPTANKKEGRGFVAEFLNNHSDFELIEEKQLLSFDKYQSTMYYALFKKVKK